MKKYIRSDINLDDIPEENKHGDCFVVALHTFLENPKKYTLVHGVVTGQGALEGVEYCHAWVIDERNDVVIDKTLPIQYQKMPVGIYYWTGKIHITKEYDYNEVLKMIDKYETYGPWDPIFNQYP